jgi:S-adenosylmethionine-dependent methyltransferase
MSRLDSHIRQKIAQRDSINLASRLLAGEEGIIVEFGLSTGRSYSHLRERFPTHEIFCFDRVDITHPRSRPPAGHLFLGEIADVLADPTILARFAGRVILANIDIGRGNLEDGVLPELIMNRIHHWLKPGSLVLSDQDLRLDPAWQLDPVETAAEVQHSDRFFVYRRRTA